MGFVPNGNASHDPFETALKRFMDFMDVSTVILTEFRRKRFIW